MIQIKELENGIRVVIEPMEQVRSVALGVYIETGSGFETAENNGISHMIEHMVFKGTKNRTAKDLAFETALIGDDLNAYTAKELTCFYGKVLDDDLPRLIGILGDMLTNSLFDAEELKKEKRVILDEIDMYEDSPEDLVEEQLQNIVWEGHPLGFIISGTKENVMRIDRDTLFSYFREHYVAQRMLISVAGHVETEALLSLLNKHFAGVPSGEKRKEILKPEYKRAKKTFYKDTEQVHLCIGFPGISHADPLNYTLSVMNNILGGSSCSRLFQRIREEEGLCYSLYSYASSYRDTGTFQIYSAMNAENLEAVYEEALNCIRDLRKNGPDEQELNQTVSQLRSEMYLSMEHTHNRMNHNARNLLFLGKIQSTDEIMDNIAKVGKQDVIDFLDRFVDEKNISLTMAGDFEENPELNAVFKRIL